MPNVTLKAINQPECGSPIEFDITPVAPLWISEVLVYLNSSYPPPPVYGKIKAGTQAHPSHVTIFVDQAILDQICGCIGGPAVDISIDYDATLTVTNVFCVAESLRVVLADLDKKLTDIGKTFHAVKMNLEKRADRVSDIAELGARKTGSDD